MKRYDVAKEFSPHPGGRYSGEGKWSGEELRAELLEAWKNKGKELLEVVLDGGYGYSASFLEEAFGGLARELKDKRLLHEMIIVSKEEPKLAEDIRGYLIDVLFADFDVEMRKQAYLVFKFIKKYLHKQPYYEDGEYLVKYAAKVPWKDVSAFYEEMTEAFDEAEYGYDMQARCKTKDLVFEIEDWIYDVGWNIEELLR